MCIRTSICAYGRQWPASGFRVVYFANPIPLHWPSVHAGGDIYFYTLLWFLQVCRGFRRADMVNGKLVIWRTGILKTTTRRWKFLLRPSNRIVTLSYRIDCIQNGFWIRGNIDDIGKSNCITTYTSSICWARVDTGFVHCQLYVVLRRRRRVSRGGFR